jgi:hypothetical protein
MRAWRILGLTLAITGLVAPSLYAQYNNRYMELSYLTFNAPFQVPGVALPAGTYRFQMAPILTGKAVVQVLSQDGQHIYASFIARQVHRVAYQAPTKTVVMFAERPAGIPQAVKEWFYPGDSFGEEFVYPRSTAVQIARVNHTSVPAIANESAKNLGAMKTAKIARVSGNGNTTPAAPATQVARQESPATPPVSPLPSETTVGTSGQTTSSAHAAARARRLPQTASDLPLVASLSLATLVAGIGVGRLRRRLA